MKTNKTMNYEKYQTGKNYDPQTSMINLIQKMDSIIRNTNKTDEVTI